MEPKSQVAHPPRVVLADDGEHLMCAQPTHIPQPPHTSGRAFSGLRTRIHPEQIPSPIEVAGDDEELWEGKSYMTLPGSQVPLSGTNYFTIDQGNDPVASCVEKLTFSLGNSSSRFIRLTTWNIPNTHDLARSCQVPIAAIIQPFANHSMDEEVPVVECEASGPARCANCRGYINPWCTWVSGGTKWKCNLCHHETDGTYCVFSLRSELTSQVLQLRLTISPTWTRILCGSIMLRDLNSIKERLTLSSQRTIGLLILPHDLSPPILPQKNLRLHHHGAQFQCILFSS